MWQMLLCAQEGDSMDDPKYQFEYCGLSSWFHYHNVRCSSAFWGDTPSGLGYSDIALDTLIGRVLEHYSQKNVTPTEYCILDLGTYFGHSAFSVVYGAATVSKDPALRVLSVDTFKQPQWLVENNSEVIKFIKSYGSTEPDAIGRRLDLAFSQIGLTRNPVQLLSRDVLTLTAGDLLAFAPKGYRLIMVDCAKTPELMNRIVQFLTDSRVCPMGAIALFQDLFDWHAPWNVYALWRLFKEGVFSLVRAGTAVTPFAEKAAVRKVGTICDQIKESPLVTETWCTAFTTLENEMAALDEFIQMFRGWGYIGAVLKLRCLKVGALLRDGRLDEADGMIKKLDQIWPAQFADYALQNAYCRLQHLRTGQKDLSLILDTPAHRFRSSFVLKKLRYMWARLMYLRPVRCERMSQVDSLVRTSIRKRVSVH